MPRHVRTKSGKRLTVSEAQGRGLEELVTGCGGFHRHYIGRTGRPVCGHHVADFEVLGAEGIPATCGTCIRIEASPTSRRKIRGAL